MTSRRATGSSTCLLDINEVPEHCGAWCMKALRNPVACRISPLEPPDEPLTGDRLHFWSGRLSPGTAPEIVADLAGFSRAERLRMARFSQVEDRAGYAAAHGAVRFALSTLLGKKPDELEIVHTPTGAPRLADHSVPRFSITHCGELAAIAIATRQVGVDIERVTWSDDLLDVAEQFFSPSVRNEIETREQCRRANAFARHWTLSEAFAKATGCGFATAGSATFSVDDRPRLLSVHPRFGTPADWKVGMF